MLSRTRAGILVLSMAVASLVAGAGVIFMGAMQQSAVPEYLRAQVWADGWKSKEEIQKGESGDYLSFLSEDSDVVYVGAPKSSLMATKIFVGWGVALLTLGSGLLSWYIVDLRTSSQSQA